MTRSELPAPRTRSLQRRALFSLFLVLLIYGLLEVFALAAWWATTGESFTFAGTETGPAPVGPNQPAAEEDPGKRPDPTMAVHPYLGYVYTPAANDMEFGRRLPMPISEHGFIDYRDPLHQRQPDKLIVGLLGGSVAGRLSLQTHQVLAQELKKLAPFRGKEIEFVRLAPAGYRQPQQLIALSYVLAQGGQFDLVLNLDGFNEIAVPAVLCVPNGVSPLFPMNWHLLAGGLPDPELQRHMAGASYLRSRRRHETADFADSFLAWSVTMTLWWKLQDERLAAAQAEHVRTLLALQKARTTDQPYFIRGPRNQHAGLALLVQMVSVWQRCSLQMQALCQAHGILYFHFLQPNQYVEGSKSLTRAERQKGWSESSPYREVVVMGYPLLRRAGQELKGRGVAFHDMTQVFAENRETLYVDTCCHFNRAGNVILSRAMVRAIAEGL